MVVRRPTEGPGHKDEPDLPPNLFVIGLLHDLKEGGYSRRAWAAFWRASWIRSMQIFHLNDELRASWLRFSITGAIGIVLTALAVLRAYGMTEAIVFALTSLLWWGVLMFDLALHLGLMVNLESGELQSSLGWPNRLTEVRGFAAVWVAWCAHWASQGSYLPLAGARCGFATLAGVGRRRHQLP